MANNYVQAGPYEIVVEHDLGAGKKHAKLRFISDIPDDLLGETHAAILDNRGARLNPSLGP
jgi:hypothetical protein